MASKAFIFGPQNLCAPCAPRFIWYCRVMAHAHLMHLNPFPTNLGEVLSKYSKILIPEMNLGQLSRLVRAEYLVDAKSLTKVQGLPFRAAEIEAKMLEMING